MTFPADIDLHTAYEDDAPAAPDKVSASTLDADHLELERWINDEFLPALAQIMREDGTLTDYLVRYRNLHPEVFTALTEAAGSVDLAIPADGSVSTTKLALLAVTTGILSDLCVSTAKLADLAVTTAKLADLSVTTSKVADLGVTTGKIDDLAVTAAKIADATVTNAKLAQMAASSIKGNDTGAPAAAKDLTVSEARTLLGMAGLEHFAASRSVAAPNATVPVHSLTPAGSEVDVDVAIVPKGDGAIVAVVPDGTATGGNKRGKGAVDLQVSRNTAAHVASGDFSVVIGQWNTAAHQDAIAHGFAGVTKQINSVVHGDQYNYGAAFFTGGQRESLALKKRTTNATVTALTDATGSGNTVPLSDNDAVMVTVQVVGYQEGGTNNAAGYVVEFTAKRGVGVGTVALVGSPVIRAQENNAAWDCTVAADTTNGGINIQVTGAAGVNVCWWGIASIARMKRGT